VTERTVQLQLANHAKDSFLATMSHEIRTPLAGLLGMMELLSLSKLEQEQAEMLNAAQKSGSSLLRIVNDILDWSKIEAGKLELAPRSTTVSDMLKSVTSTYAQIASEKDIHLKVEIDPQLSAAHYFDPLRVSQILNNFTSNALKFTERGTIHIRASRVALDKGAETIRFSVQDSGMGISVEQQQRLFQQYEQASAETARMYGGTGLGLAICRKLAELMGGTLSVESTLGHGSTFSFTVDLPVAEQAEQDRLQQHRVAQQKADEVPDICPLNSEGQRIAILIVDDHPLNRMLLKQQLGMLGVQVEAAADGNEALAKYQAASFDLIITDCHMPEMDGYELTYRIREREKSGDRHIPIIAWTANVLSEEVEHCTKAGMDDLLTKPTELADLRAMLVKWLISAGVL
jgi:CheY-like chemotaxis protein